MGDLAKLLRLNASEFADMLRAALLLPWIALALKRKGLGGVRAVPPRLQAVHNDPGSRERALQIARMVSISARRGPYRANCLVRSLTLERLLARAGIPAEFRLGVRKVDQHLEAHAWIELEGRPLAEPLGVAMTFAPFDALAPPSRQ